LGCGPNFSLAISRCLATNKCANAETLSDEGDQLFEDRVGRHRCNLDGRSMTNTDECPASQREKESPQPIQNRDERCAKGAHVSPPLRAAR